MKLDPRTLAQQAGSAASPVAAREIAPASQDVQRFLALIERGRVARHERRFEEAISAYEEAAQLSTPGTDAWARAQAATIEIMLGQGQQDEAAECIAALIEAGTRHPYVLALFARVAPKLGQGERCLALLDEAERSRIEDAGQHAAVLFARANLLDAAGAYDEAFESAARGNAVRLEQHGPFDTHAFELRIEQLLDGWTREFLDSVCHMSHDRWVGPAPVLLVGLPRCGSSLAEAVLAAHPDAVGVGESTASDDAVRELYTTSEAQGMKRIDALRNQAMIDQTSAFMSQRYAQLAGAGASGAQIVLDKQLSNWQRLYVYQQLAPGTRVVWCRRDPLDLGLSCFMHDFEKGVEFTRELDALGRVHTAHEDLMRHWKSELDLPIYELVYEDVVEDHERSVRELLDFVGLGFHEACLEHWRTPHAIVTSSAEQVRRPIYRSAVGRAQQYAHHLGPLRDALGLD